MAWLFAGGSASPKRIVTRPITRRSHPEFEHLESRLVFSANVWLRTPLARGCGRAPRVAFLRVGPPPDRLVLPTDRT
jgi:hypothetical protein